MNYTEASAPTDPPSVNNGCRTTASAIALSRSVSAHSRTPDMAASFRRITNTRNRQIWKRRSDFEIEMSQFTRLAESAKTEQPVLLFFSHLIHPPCTFGDVDDSGPCYLSRTREGACHLDAFSTGEVRPGLRGPRQLTRIRTL